ncbi:MAG: copper resistance protein CopC [Firmicutes bacterium]|nr:copper resistance protein CopC [Bacillota bacterium]
MQIHQKTSLALLATLLLFASAAGTAQAHAGLEESVPADGAVLSAPPPEVRVTFTEPLEFELSTLTLVDAQGQPVPGTTQAAAGDRILTLRLPPLPSGAYRVLWRILARDGHVTEGSIGFTVAASGQEQPGEPPAPAPAGGAQPAPAEPSAGPGAPGAAPAAPPAPETASERPTRSLLPWIAAGGLAVAGAAVVALGLRGRRGG